MVSFLPQTSWHNRDSPSGNGDHELLQLILAGDSAGDLCDKPSAIDARIAESHKPYQLSGNYVQLSAAYGLQCWNKFQPKRTCADFEVRFCCPRTAPPCEGEWSRWINRDMPSGVGDVETLHLIKQENPEEIRCLEPSQVEARARK